MDEVTIEKIAEIIGKSKKEKDDTSRKPKKQEDIFQSIQLIRKATKNRKNDLEKKDKSELSDDEKIELNLLKKDTLYETYMRTLNQADISSFLGMDKPVNSGHIIIEEANLRPDKMYFWLLDFTSSGFNMKYKDVIKTEDSVSFGAMSQFGGQHNQIRGGKQQVAQQYLKTISEVMRGLFPLLYEIKQSDELISLFNAANKLNETGKDGKIAYSRAKFETKDENIQKEINVAFSAERTLRDKWASESDGGKLFTFAKPQSQQGPGYVLLPHWFFSVKIRAPEKNSTETWPTVIKEATDLLVKNNSTNNEIANVLGNFLLRFKIWQEESYKQLKATRQFKISYLRQQYANIRLYIEWLRPILKSINSMSPKLGRNNSYKNHPEDNPYLFSILDTTQLELEFAAYKKPRGDGDDPSLTGSFYEVILVTLAHKSASLTFDVGGQNQNMPFGSNDILIRGYAWTQEQFDAYKRKKETDEFDILESLYDSMTDVREQLEKYIKEGIDTDYAEALLNRYPQNYSDATVKKFKSAYDRVFDMKGLLGPFSHLFDGLKSGFSPILNIFSFSLKSNEKEVAQEWYTCKERSDVESSLNRSVFVVYEIFKKANKYTTW
ncbi:MAG: hypothetical protein WC755_05275 [Candidatus Woesearchaeota archaeon]